MSEGCDLNSGTFSFIISLVAAVKNEIWRTRIIAIGSGITLLSFGLLFIISENQRKYFYNPNTWFSGIILFFFLMATAFMGYVLPFGRRRPQVPTVVLQEWPDS